MVLIPTNESESLKAVDKAVDNRFNLLKNFDLNLYPLTCKKEYLQHLAFLFDVDITNLEERETRNLLNKAISLKKYTGSLFYLKEMLKTIENISIQEWFDYNGEPYHFMVTIESIGIAYTQEEMKKLENKINTYKNVRSVLDAINVTASIDTANIYLGTSTSSFEMIELELVA